MRDDYIKNFVAYWRMNYNWKEQEKMMNKFNHYKTNIEGLDIHFIHEKPPNLPPNSEACINRYIVVEFVETYFVYVMLCVKHRFSIFLWTVTLCFAGVFVVSLILFGKRFADANKYMEFIL